MCFISYDLKTFSHFVVLDIMFISYHRILLKSDDSLEILEPVETDVGFYTCNATNSLGSASVSIAITLAGR